jgi:hypothetical protein
VNRRVVPSREQVPEEHLGSREEEFLDLGSHLLQGGDVTPKIENGLETLELLNSALGPERCLE